LIRRRPFIGTWRVIDMELWEREDLDLLGPAQFTLDRSGLRTLRFLAIEAALDYRTTQRDGQPSVEFSFGGCDEGDRISGRGWAVLAERTLHGRLIFHNGDESGFSASRRVARRRTVKQRARTASK
jgi:hypothetical protein